MHCSLFERTANKTTYTLISFVTFEDTQNFHNILTSCISYSLTIDLYIYLTFIQYIQGNYMQFLNQANLDKIS